MMALTTYMYRKGHYPPPVEFDKQQAILDEITDQKVISWETVLSMQLEVAQETCAQARL